MTRSNAKYNDEHDEYRARASGYQPPDCEQPRDHERTTTRSRANNHETTSGINDDACVLYSPPRSETRPRRTTTRSINQVERAIGEIRASDKDRARGDVVPPIATKNTSTRTQENEFQTTRWTQQIYNAIQRLFPTWQQKRLTP